MQSMPTLIRMKEKEMKKFLISHGVEETEDTCTF